MSNFDGDLALFWEGGDGGDVKKQYGDYLRAAGIQNAVYILIGTLPDSWSNVVRRDPRYRIPGLDLDFTGTSTTDELRDFEAKTDVALYPLIEFNIAAKVTTVAYNPMPDDLILEISIIEKGGAESTFKVNWAKEFNNLSKK